MASTSIDPVVPEEERCVLASLSAGPDRSRTAALDGATVNARELNSGASVVVFRAELLRYTHRLKNNSVVAGPEAEF